MPAQTMVYNLIKIVGNFVKRTLKHNQLQSGTITSNWIVDVVGGSFDSRSLHIYFSGKL